MYGNGGGRSYKAAEKKSEGKYKTRNKQMNIWDEDES